MAAKGARLRRKHKKDGIYAAINIKMQKGAAKLAAPFCILYFISQKQY